MVKQLITRDCEFVPKDLEPGILYVLWMRSTAVHLCCCGCGERVWTPTRGGVGEWYLEINEGNKPSLLPTIRNSLIPCKSHYLVQDGEVTWCEKPVNRESGQGEQNA